VASSRHKRKAVILAPVTMIAAALGATAAATSASAAAATYPPPSIHLLCTAAANSGTLEGSVCALPFGVTTAPNSYTATIAVSKAGAAGPSVAFAVTAGSLPPGLSLAPSSGSGTVITGNPTKAGTFTFTIKATDGGLTSTLAYEITVTVQGAPDRLLCDPADNGGFLISGVCELPATFTGSGDTIGGTPASPGVEPDYTFTVQGAGDQGQPLCQAYSIMVDPNEPLAINASGGSTLSPGTVGQPFAQDFFLSGGAAPSNSSSSSPPEQHAGQTARQQPAACSPRGGVTELIGHRRCQEPG